MTEYILKITNVKEFMLINIKFNPKCNSISQSVIFFILALFYCNAHGGEMVGYWDQGWRNVTPPSEANLSIGFMGYSDVITALEDNKKLINRMVGQKYLAIGGGNEKGKFTPLAIKKISKAIREKRFSGYQGVAFDIEVCEGNHLIKYFSEVFSVAQKNKLMVLVTISHSEPYACKDSKNLMMAILNDRNINFISPQLYTTGQEKKNNFISIGTHWEIYQKTKAEILPSIVHPSLYPEAKKFFISKGVKVRGFIKWGK